MKAQIKTVNTTEIFRHYTSAELEVILLKALLEETKDSAIVRPRGRKVTIEHIPETEGSPAYRTGTSVRINVVIDRNHVEDRVDE